MKSSKLAVLLLVLNLGVFLGILNYFLKSDVGVPLSITDNSSSKSVAMQRSTVQEKVVAVTNQLQWTQLESEDYREYIARLRSVGCPEQTIRDIIIADLDKLLAPEIQAVYGRRKELKYWHPEEEEAANDVDPREALRKQREIDKRKREIIRELINTDLARARIKASGQEDYYERRLSFLPEDRRTQVRELLEKYDEAESAIRDKELADGETLTVAERAQLRAFHQRREAELDALLSPEEKAQYELWLSPTANAVRHALYGMNATEQEFLTVYQARKAFEDTWARRDSELLDPATHAQMEQARLRTEAQIRQSLGDQRYAEFKRGEDEDFHLLSAVVTRFKLPKEKAVEVYGYKRVAQDYRAQVQTDPNMTQPQKEEALKAIAEETERAVGNVFGQRVLNYYLRTGQGRWIRE